MARDCTTPHQDNERDTYDVIIIGGGTAGCVLANRLSEDPDIQVLLIEAGEDKNHDPNVYAPGHCVNLLNNPDYDWQYESEPQDGLHGRRQHLNEQHLNKKRSGHLNGPIQASYASTFSQRDKAWLDTFKALGFAETSNPLEGAAMGGHLSTCHVTTDTRERSHAGSTYIETVKTRRNIHLLTGALVERILFDAKPESLARTTGVSYIRAGRSNSVFARKEVILAAGAFGSPQLLELSGIGSSTLLKNHGIDVVYDNPAVGENLQDHIRSGLSFEKNPDVDPRTPVDKDSAQRMYDESRTGPLADFTCHTFAYMPLDEQARASLRPSLDHYLNDTESTAFEKIRNDFIRRMIESPTEATATAFLSSKPATSEIPGVYVSIFGMLSHPFSRGHVHIKSASAQDKPVLDFGYYSHPLDAEVHAHHIQFFERLAATAPLSSLIKPGGQRLPVNCNVKTIEEAKEHVRNVSQTNYHPCGTCAMMSEDVGGVVDDRLKVYGTSNLRIVDASVFPIIPRGNIITTVYAVAEKAADLIGEDLNITRTS